MNLYYLDVNNSIKLDGNTGLLDTCKRKMASLLGQRNYNVFDVFNKAVTSSTNLKNRDIVAIRQAVTKKLGITCKKTERAFHQLFFSGKKDKQKIIHGLSSLCMDTKLSKKLEELQKRLTENTDAKKNLSKLLEETNLKVKMKVVQLDPTRIDKHFEDYQFLFKTRLIYSILGFKNSTVAGQWEHGVLERTDQNGKGSLFIKKQGQWASVKSIREEFNWDKNEGMIATKGNSNERWNYFNEGLVPIDRFFHHEAADQANYPAENAQLHPVTKLSSNEMTKLLAHAKKFKGFNTHLNPRKEKEPLNCVIQFITNPRPDFKHEALQNLNGQIPVHCGIRIVTQDGSVYSTGFGSTLHEDKYNAGGTKYLGTINGQPTILDYEEFRTHQGRVVTSLPVNEKQAKAILDHLNAYRKDSIRFNILKQNCMCLGTNILGLSGVKLNIKVPFNEVIWRALPNVSQLPIVGKPIRSFLKEIKKVKKGMNSKIPQSVKIVFHALSEIVLFVPTKISTLCKNLFILSFGGKIASPVKTNVKLQEFEKEESPLINFNQLVCNLFDDSASDVQHSSVFINWQLKQKSTVVHSYSGQPNIQILPPVSASAKQYSTQRKEEFNRVYERSIPMDEE